MHILILFRFVVQFGCFVTTFWVLAAAFLFLFVVEGFRIVDLVDFLVSF